MQGEVLIPFVATLDGRKYRLGQGELIDIPPNADWVTAGLVKVVEAAPETIAPKKPKKGAS